MGEAPVYLSLPRQDRVGNCLHRHTETCVAPVFDAEGICRSVLAVSFQASRRPAGRAPRGSPARPRSAWARSTWRRSTPPASGMTALRTGGADAFARTEKNGRISLIRSARVVRFEAARAKSESGVHDRRAGLLRRRRRAHDPVRSPHARRPRGASGLRSPSPRPLVRNSGARRPRGDRAPHPDSPPPRLSAHRGSRPTRSPARGTWRARRSPLLPPRDARAWRA